MEIAYLGEKIFREEIASSQVIWVIRGKYKNIYAIETDGGYSLPVWSSRERVEVFFKNAFLSDQHYGPEAVPLEVFTNSWLSDKMMAICLLQINPEGKTSRVLVMTPEEFPSG